MNRATMKDAAISILLDICEARAVTVHTEDGRMETFKHKSQQDK